MADGADAAGDAAAAGEKMSERDAASRTFFTTIDAEPIKKPKDALGPKKNKFRTLESTNAGPRIIEHHQDLTTLANSLDERMAALLREHEKDFFLAYKTHMYTVQKEIKTLRMKADHEEAKTREDTKIKALEGELDWFMTEALRLDELCKGYKKEVDKWKAKAEALDEDRRFLEDQIKGAKRQNKILRAAAERARSSAYSALMATRSRSEAKERQSGGYPSEEQTLALPARPLSASSPSQSRTLARRPSAPHAAGRGASGNQDADRFAEALARPRPPSSPSQPRALTRGPSADPAGRSVLGSEAEERYVEAIQHLKESIVREQQNVRMLQAARAASYSRKSELEEFFLKCIDEARKDLMRRRHLTVHREKSERERVFEAMLNNEDVLVCLYEKLFPHRTGIARSLGVPAGAVGEDPTMLAQLL